MDGFQVTSLSLNAIDEGMARFFSMPLMAFFLLYNQKSTTFYYDTRATS
jgi:hypothetical protein